MPYSDNNGCPGGGTNHNLVIKTPSNHSFARDPTTLLKIQPIIIFLFRCASIFRLYPCDSVTRSAEFQISGFCVITRIKHHPLHHHLVDGRQQRKKWWAITGWWAKKTSVVFASSKSGSQPRRRSALWAPKLNVGPYWGVPSRGGGLVRENLLYVRGRLIQKPGGFKSQLETSACLSFLILVVFRVFILHTRK